MEELLNFSHTLKYSLVTIIFLHLIDDTAKVKQKTLHNVCTYVHRGLHAFLAVHRYVHTPARNWTAIILVPEATPLVF